MVDAAKGTRRAEVHADPRVSAKTVGREWEMADVELFDMRDRVVLITGGGRGIGRTLALAFAAGGAKVAVASRTVAEIEAVAVAARERSDALAVAVDLTDLASIDRLIGTVMETFGRLDVLVNNAGIYVNRPALELTAADWDLMADTNLKGLFFCARDAAQAMVQQGAGGRIINVSSALAVVAQVGYACYGATKAGVQHLTRVLALEWAPYGITVNAVAPTTTATEQNAARLATPEARAQARDRIPLGRYGQPGDLVGAVLYLASPASAFMTGQTLVIDGGLSLP